DHDPGETKRRESRRPVAPCAPTAARWNRIRSSSLRPARGWPHDSIQGFSFVAALITPLASVDFKVFAPLPMNLEGSRNAEGRMQNVQRSTSNVERSKLDVGRWTFSHLCPFMVPRCVQSWRSGLSINWLHTHTLTLTPTLRARRARV